MTHVLADYLHRLDPFVFRFPDVAWLPAGIRWYGASYLLAFLVGYLLIRRVTRVGISTLKSENVADMVVYIAMGIIIGGRLGYVFFYDTSLLFDPPLIGIIQLWKGGMASHGGMIGGIVATALYARRHHHSFSHLIDLAAFGTPVGLFFGRIANFINGELFGRPCSPDLPWAVKFPREIESWSYEQLSPLATLSNDGSIHVGRILDEIQAGNPNVISIIEPLLTPRHPSQIYQALLEGLLLFIVLAIVWIRPRKPLIVGATFLIGYGILRIVGEAFRLPDEQIGYQALGLTRGQWLSVPVVAAGIALFIFSAKRNAARMGGWVNIKSTD